MMLGINYLLILSVCNHLMPMIKSDSVFEFKTTQKQFPRINFSMFTEYACYWYPVAYQKWAFWTDYGLMQRC